MTTMQEVPAKKRASKPSKVAYFVRVQDPEGGVAFHNITVHLGKQMPFAKPQATCAMQVREEIVAFSLLHLTKNTAKSVAAGVVDVPRGPLARLERRAQPYLNVPAGEVIADLNGVAYRLRLEVDETGVGRVEAIGRVDNPEDDAEGFELPRGALHIDIYLKSPKVDRLLAVGFIGHVGKPGDPDTVARAVAKVLNSLSGLSEFRILSGIETMQVPAGPSRWAARANAVKKIEAEAATAIPVWLFTEPTADGTPPSLVASGEVIVTVDLEHANPNSGRLLCHYSPSEAIIEHFEAYRTTFDMKIAADLRADLGDDLINDMGYNIVLGDVDLGMLDTLRESLTKLNGLDLTPTQVRDHV